MASRARDRPARWRAGGSGAVMSRGAPRGTGRGALAPLGRAVLPLLVLGRIDAFHLALLLAADDDDESRHRLHAVFLADAPEVPVVDVDLAEDGVGAGRVRVVLGAERLAWGSPSGGEEDHDRLPLLQDGIVPIARAHG